MDTKELFKFLKENAKYGFRGTNSKYFEMGKLSAKEVFGEGRYIGSLDPFNNPRTSICFDPFKAGIYAKKSREDTLFYGTKTKPVILIVNMYNYRKNIEPGEEFITTTEVVVKVPINLTDIVILSEKELENINKYLTYQNGVPIGFSEYDVENFGMAMNKLVSYLRPIIS